MKCFLINEKINIKTILDWSEVKLAEYPGSTEFIENLMKIVLGEIEAIVETEVLEILE
jgi:hypothetical protein